MSSAEFFGWALAIAGSVFVIALAFVFVKVVLDVWEV